MKLMGIESEQLIQVKFDDQNICIQINNINDVEPVVTSPGGFSADENQLEIGTVTAIDGDGGLTDVTFSLMIMMQVMTLLM